VFHRVIPNFMIQGGGMDENLSSKPTRDPIKNEADNGESNTRGTLAMARTGVVDSATSQFFINLRDNDFLNHGTRDFGYAVFGRVADGMDIVDAIAAVETGNRGGHQDVPVEAVTILEVTVDD
jgi:cyclophilin family peptidyl-prolyl cis-trans isomerase